mgnify:CR=1 FL=1
MIMISVPKFLKVFQITLTHTPAPALAPEYHPARYFQCFFELAFTPVLFFGFQSFKDFWNFPLFSSKITKIIENSSKS